MPQNSSAYRVVCCVIIPVLFCSSSFFWILARVIAPTVSGRKVRAPQDSVVGNAHPPGILLERIRATETNAGVDRIGPCRSEKRQSLRGGRSNRGRSLTAGSCPLPFFSSPGLDRLRPHASGALRGMTAAHVVVHRTRLTSPVPGICFFICQTDRGVSLRCYEHLAKLAG